MAAACLEIGQLDPNSMTDVNTRWYALRVRSRHEKSTGLALAGKGIEQFVPLYRSRRSWSDRACDVELPLFPGYVFCRFDPQVRVPIVTTPGVVDIVRIGKYPQPVDPDEMKALQLAVASGQYLQLWSFLKAQEKVVIAEGPLRNVQGVFVESKDADHVILSITLLQRSVAVTVNRAWIRPCAGPLRN